MAAFSGTLLFQGDSITDAFRRPEELNDSYRLGNGYAFIAGSLLRATAGDPGLSVQNRGISGNTAADLLARWPRDCLELRPDALSLLVGVNDANRCLAAGDDPLPGFAPAYDALLRLARDALPRCRLILVEPFALACGAEGAGRLRLLAPIQAHVRAAALRTGATLVPLQDEFAAVAGAHPERWLYDGIHPTAAGQWLIARQWLARAAGVELPAAVPMPS